MRLAALAAFAALAAAGCDQRPDPQPEAKQQPAEPEPDTVDIPQVVEKLAPGTTPMAERVAVLGLLNKRNGIAQDLTLKPGQAVRVGDVVVRLRACETTAPWEVQQLTGAFVQLDVAGTDDQMRRVFSGWLYKETPSLNVVEHPVYDVWPKSCAMTHPEAAGSAVWGGSAPHSPPPPPHSAPPPASPPATGPQEESASPHTQT